MTCFSCRDAVWTAYQKGIVSCVPRVGVCQVETSRAVILGVTEKKDKASLRHFKWAWVTMTRANISFVPAAGFENYTPGGGVRCRPRFTTWKQTARLD